MYKEDWKEATWWQSLFQYKEIRKALLIIRDTKSRKFPLKSEADCLVRNSALDERYGAFQLQNDANTEFYKQGEAQSFKGGTDMQTPFFKQIMTLSTGLGGNEGDREAQGKDSSW